MTEELTDMKYVFSEEEFEFLASAAGVRELLCFCRKKEDMTDAAAKKCLFDLSKRGIITVEENRILINKPFSDIFRSLASRKKTLKIIKNDGITFVYITEDMHAVEAANGRKKGDYIVLEYLDREGLMDRLSASLPDNMIPEDILFMKTDTADEGEENVIWAAFVMDNNNEEVESFRIISQKAYLYLLCMGSRSIYKKAECVERIMPVLEERK